MFSLRTVAMLAAVALPGAPLLRAQTVPAVTGSSIAQQQAQAALDFHNAKRKAVGVASLAWSPQLAGIAQQWANHLAADLHCSLEHQTGNTHGENLFGGSGAPYTALDAAQDWYSEIKLYHYGPLTPSNWYPTGHYTQMVWANTRSVGMGQASCPDGSTVIVAEYDPSGNYMGQKPY